MNMKRIIILCTIYFVVAPLQAQIPINDACENATEISAFPYNEVSDATGASNNSGSLAIDGCGQMNDGVWFTFLGTGFPMTISAFTSEFDLEIGIYRGECDDLKCITNVDDSFDQTGESVRIATILGLRYYVNVGYWDIADGAEGEFTINVESDTLLNEPCGHSQLSDQFESAALIGNGRQSVAADFLVSINTPAFNLDTIKVNLSSLAPIDSLDIIFYEDSKI